MMTRLAMDGWMDADIHAAPLGLRRFRGRRCYKHFAPTGAGILAGRSHREPLGRLLRKRRAGTNSTASSERPPYPVGFMASIRVRMLEVFALHVAPLGLGIL